MSRQRRDEDYVISIHLELPKNHVPENEIRLVTSCLGELLKRVIRDKEIDEE